MIDGAGYGKNTKALIFTKCLKEIQNFGVSLGANQDTFYGLCCLGDLMLDSRNRYLGVEFIKGRKIEDLIKEKNCTFEGIRNIKNAIIIAKRLNINIPIINNLNSVLFEGLSINDAVKNIIG
jgi:glycerol-3-phosphate dehydrogenase (NAD(P)+)